MDQSRVTRFLLAGGVIGAPLFVVVFSLDGATRAGYDPAYHPVSALSLGERGWLQITNFVVTGLLLLAFAIGLRRALRGRRGARWGPLLVGGFSLALLLSGPFVMDPMRGYPPGAPAGEPNEASWHHTMHDLLGAAVFLLLPIACFVVAGWFAGQPGRRGWMWYCVLTGLVSLTLLIGFGAAWEADHEATGLLQRLMIVAGWSWLAFLALRLYLDQRSVTAAGRVAQAHSGPPAPPEDTLT